MDADEIKAVGMVASKTFNTFVESLAESMNMCPSCVYTLIKAYIGFNELSQSSERTEH